MSAITPFKTVATELVEVTINDNIVIGNIFLVFIVDKIT